ncbi:MAG: hypothetical protein HY870_24965, partial [Chloroflexi bacterium]|nr:hypothetical protein [Chloroflexota bacterium]
MSNDTTNNITGDATYETWLKLSASTYLDGGTNWHLFSNETYQASGMLVRVDGGTGKLYYRSNQASASTDTTSSTVLDNNKWYHVAVVKSGTTVTFYVNGVATGYASGSGTVTNPVTTANAMTLGS